MERLENATHIWDNGKATPVEHTSPEEVWVFRQETGASRIIYLDWLCDGVKHRCTYPAEVLPDHSGVVAVADVIPGEPFPTIRKKLEVIDACGTLRCVIRPPLIDNRSDPAISWLNTPENYRHRGVPFGVPASDGWRFIVMDIDWQTGDMLNWVLAPNLMR